LGKILNSHFLAASFRVVELQASVDTTHNPEAPCGMEYFCESTDQQAQKRM
jgi:hypothetical protein